MASSPAAYNTGTYLGDWTTGVLAATLAADSPIASIRCGPTQTDSVIPGGLSAIGSSKRRIYVVQIGIKVSGVVAFTAAQQFGLYLQRFSAANMAAGSTRLPLKVGASTVIDSVAKAGGAEGGEIRVATTATLTTVGVTLAAEKIPVYQWSTVGPAEYPDRVIDFWDLPIELAPGEGLALVNQILWPAAGTAVVGAYIKYEERSVL